MCGLIAVSIEGKNSDKFQNIFAKLLLLSKTRGSDSSGVIFVKTDRIAVIKGSMPIDQLLSSSAIKAYLQNNKDGNFTAFGHTRMETHGSKFSHKNNHPILSRGIAILHNGIITNADSIWSNFTHGNRETQVDSEVLCAVVENALHDVLDITGFKAKVQKNLEYLKGSYTFIALVPSLGCAILSTNTGSLYKAQIFENEAKAIIYASEEVIVKNALKSLDFDEESYSVSQVSINEIEIIPLSKHNGAILDYDLHELSGTDAPLSHQNSTNIIPIERLVTEGYEKTLELRKTLLHCKKCILPSTMPYISFDSTGICNFCNRFHAPKLSNPEELIRSIQKNFESAKFKGVLLPFSGGRDSSYALHYVKKILKIPVITCTYDWGMLTDLGRRNQARMLGSLNVENILLSADINTKRSNINKNLSAWLKDPNLGIVPLLMAGDKHYFRHINRVRGHLGNPSIIYSDNPLEKSDFKYGFANVQNNPVEKKSYEIGSLNTLKLLGFYGFHFLTHPSYWNGSLLDTITAYWSSYFEPKEFLHLYKYIEWEEQKIISVLQSEYDWELAPDTTSSWRIGDGTAALYNFIYFMLAGFTEHDTFRSNQIRCGIISRDEAWNLALSEARPRTPSLLWYFDTINLSALESLKIIDSKALYKNSSNI